MYCFWHSPNLYVKRLEPNELRACKLFMNPGPKFNLTYNHCKITPNPFRLSVSVTCSMMSASQNTCISTYFPADIPIKQKY